MTAKAKTKTKSTAVAKIAKKPGTAVMIRQEGNTPGSATATMVALAQSKDFDAVKFKALAEFQEKMVTQQAMIDFVTAQHAMQPHLPEITADRKIEIEAKKVGGKHQSTPYATLANINRIIKPILQEHGFTLSHRNGEENGKVLVVSVLSRGLHSIESRFVGQVENSGSKNNVQGVGATISYGRRYNTVSLLNLTTAAKEDGDDDGKMADMLMAPISAEQLKNLKQQMKEVNANFEKFCDLWGINDVSELQVKNFEAALRLLAQKKKVA